MKRIFLWCILLFAGCTQSPIEDVVVEFHDEFYAGIEEMGDSFDSRTYLDEKIRLCWTADDRITIFKKSAYNREFKFTGTTGSNSGGFAQVSVDDESWYGVPLQYNYAAYPHSDAMSFHEDGYFVLTMSAEQTYVENSVGLGANTMVAMSEGDQLMFKNVGSFLRVRLWGDNQQVKSVTLTTKGEEVLAGLAKITPSLTEGPLCEMIGSTKSITLNCITPITISDSEDTPTDFWIVLPPTTFASGFTVTVRNQYENTQTFDIEKSFTFEQNTYYNLKREVMMDLIPNNEIWYTSTDGQVVTPYATDVFGANIVSNTYEGGKGIIKFDNDVKEVGSDAFWQCINIKGITLPESVESIGDNSFYMCENLEQIDIPDSVESIGNWVFCYCYSLKNITIPNGVISIGQETFGYCTELTTITLPDSVSEIGEGLFSGCSKLQSFYGKFSTADHSSLIANGTFIALAMNSGVTEVHIPEGVTAIGYGAFRKNSNLLTVSLPTSLTRIGRYAFQYCQNLSNVTIPEQVTRILYRAFMGCESFTSVTIPSSVTELEEGAFSYCI